MFRYLVRRILWAVVLFIAVTMVSFVIFFIVPVEPARLIAGPQAPPDAVERAKKAYHLDDPVWKQYLRFMKTLVVDGSLGKSLATRQEVNDVVRLRTRDDLARHRRCHPVDARRRSDRDLIRVKAAVVIDRAAMVFVLIGISAHPVWIGLILSYFIGYKLQLTPLGGYCDLINPSTDCGGPVDWFHSMILPWITFMLLFAALYVPDDSCERAGDPERGLCAHGPCQGRARVPGHALARAAKRLAAGRDDARDGHRARARRRDLHRVGVRPPRVGQSGGRGPDRFRPADRDGHHGLRHAGHPSSNLAVDLLYAVIDPRIRLT